MLLFALIFLLLPTLFVDAQSRPKECINSFYEWSDGDQGYKNLYNVGIVSSSEEEIDSIVLQYNKTFSQYLTSTAGSHFNPPIEFSLKVIKYEELYDSVENKRLDFIFVDPSYYSCIESEYGAKSLATIKSNVIVNGKKYEVTERGGIIFTLQNSTITSISDIKGKITAADKYSSCVSGQIQARELLLSGLSYMNDPKQVIYTNSEEKVFEGVVSGDFDTGFLRSDILEQFVLKHKLHMGLFKIIDEKTGLVNEGTPYPFSSSTPLYPDKNFAALVHVPNDVIINVQKALYRLESIANVGLEYATCYEERYCSEYKETAAVSLCREVCHQSYNIEELPCGTTIDTTLLAHEARSLGKYSGWRSTLSYSDIRTMHESTNFMYRSKCIKSSRIYDAIICPTGYYRKTEEEVSNGCRNAGLPCKEGFQCLCEPCIKGHDVNIYPSAQDAPCGKFTICGEFQQAKNIQFTAYDNELRVGTELSILIHQENAERKKIISKAVSNFTYEFEISSTKVGTIIMEIFIGGKQISQSPLQVQVLVKDCEAEYSNQKLIPDSNGNCVCGNDSFTINGKCYHRTFIWVGIFIPIVLLSIFSSYFHYRRTHTLEDFTWTIQAEKLKIPEPPIILGQGTFGLVILAEYRGTMVAVKKVLPSKQKFVANSSHGDSQKGDDSEQLKSAPSQLTRNDINLNEFFMTLELDFKTGKQMLPSKPSNLKNDDGMKTVSFNQQVRSGWRKPSFEDSRRSSNENIGKFDPKKSNESKGRKMNFFHYDEYSRLKADFIDEMRILSKLRHPCITTVMGAVISRNQEPLLILEYMELGSLYEVLHNETITLDEDLKLLILIDIVKGIRFLHSAVPVVIHGDLKTKNILIDNRFKAKVTDFGLSQKKKVGAIGTPYYMSPELIRGESKNTTFSDVYAYGIIQYEVCTRKEPYENEAGDLKQTLKLIADPLVNKRPLIPQSLSPSMSSIIKDCLVRDPANRPTFSELERRLKRLDFESFEPNHNCRSQQQKAKLNEERDSVIYGKFPKKVADALLAGKKVEPEAFPEVTILFSEIVEFDSLASQMSPEKVSDLLGRLFSRFDTLAENFNINQLETIGDTYLCATNLIEKQDDHVKLMALFAIDLISAARKTLINEDDPAYGHVKIRVGFHTGPVVASVVGSRNLKYTILGDSVNTAARMKSYSGPNRVLCSNTSATILKEHHPFIPLVERGDIIVKGKGEMKTFWVNEKKVVNISSCCASASFYQ